MRTINQLSQIQGFIKPHHFASVHVDGDPLLRNEYIEDLGLPLVQWVEQNAVNRGHVINITLKEKNGHRSSGSQKFVNVADFQYFDKNNAAGNRNSGATPVQNNEAQYNHFTPSFEEPNLSGVSKEAAQLYHMTENQRQKMEISQLKNELDRTKKELDDLKRHDFSKEEKFRRERLDLELEKEKLEKRIEDLKKWRDLAKDPEVAKNISSLAPLIKDFMPKAGGAQNGNALQQQIDQGLEGAGGEMSGNKVKLLQAVQHFGEDDLRIVLEFVQRFDESEEFARAYTNLAQQYNLKAVNE